MREVAMVMTACAALFALGQAYLARRDQRLKQERAGENFETFARPLRADGTPEHVLIHVHGFLQDWKGDRAFPVRASDSIGGVYGIVDEDYWDMVNELASVCGAARLPSEEAAAVDSVRDLVLLLALGSRPNAPG
jgi:hypothetical protein